MIFIFFAMLFSFGIINHYIAYKKGYHDGGEFTRREYNSKLNDYIEEVVEREKNDLKTKFEKMIKEEYERKHNH